MESRDVFISYSTKDQEAKNFIKNIFDNQGISYFLDENDLILGEDIEFSLKANLKNTHFTILLVSKNSLFSTWVCLESIHRLQEESFTQKITFLPILIDLSVISLDFPLEMARHFKAKLEDLEAKRVEAKQLGIATKLYNDEIERIEKVLPQIGEIIQKIKNGLSANFADENRKPRDLEKLLQIIRPNQNNTQIPAQKEETLIQYIEFQYITNDWGLRTSGTDTANINEKGNHKLLKPEEENNILIDYQDFNYPEINVEIALRVRTGLEFDQYIGLSLNYEHCQQVLTIAPPNYFYVYYYLNGERIEVSGETWQETTALQLIDNEQVTMRIQLSTQNEQPLNQVKQCVIHYYINNALVFTENKEKWKETPTGINIFSTDKIKFQAQYLKIFST